MWRVSLTVPHEAALPCEEALEAFVDAVSLQEKVENISWTLLGYAEDRPDLDGIATALGKVADSMDMSLDRPVLEELPERDWVSDMLRTFAPITAGRFVVHGTHVTENLPSGEYYLKIDAGQAFGSGEHATTTGCLTAIDDLAKEGRHFIRMLDLGCGSGILGIAMAMLFDQSVLAVDNDPMAVEVTCRNAVLNGVGEHMQAEVSDGYRAAVVSERSPYELIASNILAGPLVRFAEEAARHLAPGGFILLSGLLERQEAEVRKAHERAGLVLARRYQIGDWPTLVMQKG